MTPNEIAFTGIATEYCRTIQQATDRDELVDAMIRLLPRLYIMATDMAGSVTDDDDAWLDQSLDEDGYEQVRSSLASLLEDDDIYLDTFEEDMKYSDTPVSASIAEGLADLFQVLFNFVETLRDATDSTATAAIASVTDDFRNYWSQTLVNVMRPLNALKYPR